MSGRELDGLIFVNANAEPSGFHLTFSTFSGVNFSDKKISSSVNCFFCGKDIETATRNRKINFIFIMNIP
jgi:hypothetical protein